jgi:signal peptidase I
MQPGLHTNERVLVNSLAYTFGEPQRGDVIVFHPPDALSERYIKRVIGIPGDTIKLTPTSVFVNNIKLNEPYIAPSPVGYPENPEAETILLGVDQFFVMGDNRTNSQDSRYFGPIAQREIIGKAEFVVWPVGNIQTIDNYAATYASIPNYEDSK